MFSVVLGVVREVLFFPTVGIGQGDPFSPLLFSFCVSFLLHRLSELPRTDPYLYVDDLCIMLTGRKFRKRRQRLLLAMEDFKVVSGPTLNIGKCGLVLKGHFSDRTHRHLEDLGIALKDSVKYLGIQVGNVTTAQAFSRALEEAQRRASVLGAFPFSLQECIRLLKVWILPWFVTNCAYQ